MGEPLPGPTIFEGGPESLFGVGRVTFDEDGRFSGSMPSGAPFVLPDGAPSAGALGVLVDNVLGYAIIEGLVGCRWSVSTEIWLDLLARVPVDGGALFAEAHTIGADDVRAFSEGEIRGPNGSLVAVCRQRGLAIDEAPDDLRPLDFETPIGAADVVALTGLRVLDRETAILPVTPTVSNPRGMLHGGVALCAAETVAALAGSDHVTSSVHVTYTRPVPTGSLLELHAVVRHAGRSLRVTEVTGLVDGRLAVVAQISAR